MDETEDLSWKRRETSSHEWNKATKLMRALVKLRLETASRDAKPVDVEAQLTAYADRLNAWPIEAIERTLRDWASRSKFWPTWHELEEQLPELAPKRIALVHVAPEHKPFRDRGQNDHDPFMIPREWYDFEEAMQNLRDPASSMLAREHLIKIGEAIEARQRPHAERMGWATP